MNLCDIIELAVIYIERKNPEDARRILNRAIDLIVEKGYTDVFNEIAREDMDDDDED